VAAYSDPSGRLLGECHGLMHTVEREYAGGHDVTLENLMSYLPQTNEPGCSAASRTASSPGWRPRSISATRRPPRRSATRPIPATGATAASTASDTPSCDSYARISRLPSSSARPLGAEAPDCSQGAFHDYWFAAIGADDTTPPETLVDDPRKLCGAQDEEFVRPCWYRAFIDERPDEPISSAADIHALCEGLAGSSARRASPRPRWWARPILVSSCRSAPSSRARTRSAASAGRRCRT
jgi:hypothetical protein